MKLENTHRNNRQKYKKINVTDKIFQQPAKYYFDVQG